MILGILKRTKCPNGCSLLQRKKELVKVDGKYSFAYREYTYCPNCGSIMPQTLKAIEGFFSVFHLNERLEKTRELIYKSELSSAAREAFIVVEEVLRKKTGLDLHGVDLVNKALRFEADKKSGELIERPLISINNLVTDSEKNEQEGIRFMLMGFFQGARNIYQHNHVGSSASNTLSIIIQASYFLDILDGHSITKKGRWIPCKMDYEDVYLNMPRRIDRIRYRYRLWRRGIVRKRN